MTSEPQHTPRWHRIMKRDGFRCAYCDGELDAWNGSIDHIVPLCRGGTNRAENLCAACKTCNVAKSDMSAAAFRARRTKAGLPCAKPQSRSTRDLVVRTVPVTLSEPSVADVNRDERWLPSKPKRKKRVPAAQRARNMDPTPIATPAMLEKLRKLAAESAAAYAEAVAKASAKCGRKRYPYKSEAGSASRRKGKAAVHCSKCSGFHLVKREDATGT